MSKKSIRIYYETDSYDELVMEFLDEYAKKRGQTRKDLILEVLRVYWLPVVLKDSGLGDSFELDYLGRSSVGALASQLSLIVNQLDLKFKTADIIFQLLETKYQSKPELENTTQLESEQDDVDPIQSSVSFKKLSI